MAVKLFSLACVFIFVLCLVISTTAALYGGEIFPYEYHKKVLDNGFKIIVIPMESEGIVAYYTIVRTGSRDEYEPGHSGFAHFFEHMMFRGTEKYPGAVYDSLITTMGANANAYTSNDLTCFHLNFAKEDLERVMELESDRFQNLSYSEQAFKTEAGAVYGEYLKGLSNPFSVLFEKLMDTAFDKHTYKHTTIGFRKDIEAMPTMYEYSKSFFKRYYRPENVVLLVAGDVKPSRVFELAQKYYGGWKKGYVSPTIPVEPEQRGERRVNVSFKGKTLPILTIAYKSAVSFDPGNIEMAACLIMGELIFGETSKLYNNLVLDQQRVQFIEADFSSSRDPALLTIYTMVKKESDISNIENEIYKAIGYFQKHMVDKKELEDLKSNMKYSFLMDLNTPDNVAGNLAQMIAMTGDIDGVDMLYSTIEKVSPEDVWKAANKFLRKEKRTVVVLKGR